MVSQFASRYCLEQYGQAMFHISTFDSSEAALDAFRGILQEGDVLPDIIFLDLGLDKMDGWGFLDALQELMKDRALPKVYILSAFGKAKDRELAENHPNVLGYIEKPLTRNRLEKIFAEKEI